MAGRDPTASGAAALAAIYPVSRETLARFARYRDLLERWQQHTNLVGPDTLKEFWTRHVADSLQGLPLMPAAQRWLDIGSGGGFPGMAIAIAHAGDSARRHMLVESNARKCAFLREVAAATGARAQVIDARIESVAQQIAEEFAPQAVTARALAPLAALLGQCRPFLGVGATLFFHKGEGWRREVAECDGLAGLDLVSHPSRVQKGSVILRIRDPDAEGAARASGQSGQAP
jgi:16S rRNA (guanine527-N7)-methyltransferase